MIKVVIDMNITGLAGLHFQYRSEEPLSNFDLSDDVGEP